MAVKSCRLEIVGLVARASYVEPQRIPVDRRLFGWKLHLLAHDLFRFLGIAPISDPIPTDLEAARALSASPATLDLFTGLSYRCFIARGEDKSGSALRRIWPCPPTRQRGLRPGPKVSGESGKLELVRRMWPKCPASLDRDGRGLIVDRVAALLSVQTNERL